MVEAKSSIALILSSLNVGGSQKKFTNIANALAARGRSVHLISLGPPSVLLDKLDKETVSIFEVDRTSYFDHRAMARYRRYIVEHKLCAVLCVNEYPLIFHFSALLGAKLNTKIYASINTSSVQGLIPSSKFLLYRLILNSCDRVVFGCESERSKWRKRIGRRSALDKTIVIHNGVDTAYFSFSLPAGHIAEIKSRNGVVAEEVVLGTVAQFRREKGYEVLLRATRRLLDRGLPIRTVCVGDGPTRSEMEELIRCLEIEHNVLLLGQLNDVRDAVAMFDIFVLPSVAGEVFSNAILEGMSMGRCVVVSDIGGAREMVTPGINGYIVTPNDWESLADCVEKIVRDQSWSVMGSQSRRLVEEKFTFDGMLNEYDALLFPQFAQQVVDK
ncbi:MAG: glycosyltransferase family 4 protein [Gammaproteobacteria bacterium]|nr:glycosyltransferase family 4 protein [Gammaproteobacteria bacterium]